MIGFIVGVLLLQVVITGVIETENKIVRKKIDRHEKRMKEFERQQRRIRDARKKTKKKNVL